MSTKTRSTTTKRPTTPRHLESNVRIVTAAALFDGHDAAINIMRRLLQAQGAEVIHLGHNCAAEAIVDAAIQEDAQAIAVSSYQGGHMEFFKYMHDLLRDKGAPHIRIYGGGGGVIVPREIEELHRYGIAHIFSPEDGRSMGLEGMIARIMRECDFPTVKDASEIDPETIRADDVKSVARTMTAVEHAQVPGADAFLALAREIRTRAEARHPRPPIVGLTGTGGAGKSSLTDELLLRFSADFPDMRIAVLAVDPSKRKTGGALLGDRIRMNALAASRIMMRSLATRESGTEISDSLRDMIAVAVVAGYDLILVETSGIGQGAAAIVELVDIPLYVMTGEFGAESQLEKIEMLDHARLVAINKFERRGAEDALRAVRKQVWRNRGGKRDEAVDSMPVYPTIASRFNDPGVNALYRALLREVSSLRKVEMKTTNFEQALAYASHAPAASRQGKSSGSSTSWQAGVVPNHRVRYLSEIASCVRGYHHWIREQQEVAASLWAAARMLREFGVQAESYAPAPIEGPHVALARKYNELLARLDPHCRELLAGYAALRASYTEPKGRYVVRGRELSVENYTESLSHLRIPKVALPRFQNDGDVLAWMLSENVPGVFPYTAGVFPYKRQSEDPTRMFAGEGPPAQTNARFHLLSRGQPAARLSTAFDSVTLYGEDPALRPDIYGKVGESGVSICTVEDAEILYSGFDLCAPNCSVSMTINGPAPIILAFFMNAAARQCARRELMAEGKLKPGKEVADAWNDPRNFAQDWEQIRGMLSDDRWNRILAETLTKVRGTVQADILKEDQAQNTCIFSTEFSLRLMGDVQEYFIEHEVKNYYSVSISGYHIAEAGANPISQLAFTLANGFTYVEYYLSRGMRIDDFAPNFSFFFSNGLDPEYSVIGRVARRIWAVAMARLYGADERSQKLKYHIQTSGRSLHAMEIDFNDIRTTLQALMAIYDNCNSLHTNAFDEAITTPTESSVRRALAIQLIINRELGLARNENPLQGSFIIEELTDLVEEAVLQEFDRLTDRGGVLGAMELQYQRARIQEESMYYEHRKHSGELPIVGVNTFLSPDGKGSAGEIELRRASPESKQAQVANVGDFHRRHATTSVEALRKLQQVALAGDNVFAELMHTVEHCSLGQISGALYAVGGKYRRNM